MVVLCPKCKTRLKVDETKLPPGGSRFKCPKCATVLVVKKPAAATAPPKQEASLTKNKVLIAHANQDVITRSVSLLSKEGYQVITATDGIDAMVKALKEYPFVAVLDVALPKIFGFEVCKKIKSRPDSKDMKVILIASVYDMKKYKREPNSLYGADDYLDEPNLASELVEKIARLREPNKDETPEHRQPEQAARPEQKPAPAPVSVPDTPAQFSGAAVATAAGSSTPPASSGSNELVEKARRLARNIVNDIYLYNPAKVDSAVKTDSFYSVFANDLKEGQKLYDNRIPQETRQSGDYFREEIDNFIAKRKKSLA